jgi:hypothetical protein
MSMSLWQLLQYCLMTSFCASYDIGAGAPGDIGAGAAETGMPAPLPGSGPARLARIETAATSTLAAKASTSLLIRRILRA